MKDIKDAAKFVPTTEEGIIYKLVVSYIRSQQADDEYLICDKTSTWPANDGSPPNYRTFWYSHLAQNGGFLHVLTFYLPEWDHPFVRISPARNYGLSDKNFKLIDPEALEMKQFIRQIFDTLKKEQNRKPWPTFAS